MQRLDSDLARRALVAWFGEEHPEHDPFGEGHINGTWVVRAGTGNFVLQRLSSEVFPDPEQVARNLDQLFAAQALDQRFEYLLPQPLPALDGRTLVVIDDTEKHYFRLSRMIDQARTLQTVTNVVQARAAGEAFGLFQQMATAIEPESLREVIPGFHKLEVYSESLAAALAGRTELTIEEATLYAELDARLSRYGSKRDFVDHSCVIHGDCKVNNLLFAENADDVVAVLDLDTLMVGAWWLDFGDLVRSAAYDRDTYFRPEHYAALAEGFFAGRGEIRPEDIGAALRAPAHVTFMLAIRFFDDHLRGDRYFRVIESGDNLRRAESQFAQLAQLETLECQVFMRGVLEGLL